MKTLKQVLMERDGMSADEADELINDARNRVLVDGEDPDEVLLSDFGLEVDYVFDLIEPL